MNHEYAKELIELADTDLSVREKLAAAGKLSEGYNPEMEKIHKANAERLRQIINEIGFPTISKVGERASDAAWLIIQHAIGDPGFMKGCYKMMIENAEDINPRNTACLYDRIRFFQSRPQKYGTQFITEGVLYPVQDKERLNEERKSVSLPEWPADIINAIPDPGKIPEIDKNDSEYTAWRKKVGWID